MFYTCVNTIKLFLKIPIILHSSTQSVVNSLRPSGAYMCLHSITTLLQIMAYRLFCTKPLSEPMLPYYQLDPKEHYQWNFIQNSKLFINKNALQNFVSKMAVIFHNCNVLKTIFENGLTCRMQGMRKWLIWGTIRRVCKKKANDIVITTMKLTICNLHSSLVCTFSSPGPLQGNHSYKMHDKGQMPQA